MPVKKSDIDLLQWVKDDISIPRCVQRLRKALRAFLDRRNHEADVMQSEAIDWQGACARFSAQVNSPWWEPYASLRPLTASLLRA